jgi:hypothetical protein
MTLASAMAIGASRVDACDAPRSNQALNVGPRGNPGNRPVADAVARNASLES